MSMSFIYYTLKLVYNICTCVYYMLSMLCHVYSICRLSAILPLCIYSSIFSLCSQCFHFYTIPLSSPPLSPLSIYTRRPGDKYGLTSPSQWAAFGLMSTESAKSNVFVFPDNLTSPLGASSSLMDKKTAVSA